jgi:hypothetical protein
VPSFSPFSSGLSSSLSLGPQSFHPSPLFCSTPLIGQRGEVRGVRLRRLPLVPTHLPPPSLLPIHMPPPPLFSPSVSSDLCPSGLFSSPLVGPLGDIKGVTLRRLPLIPVSVLPVHLPPPSLLPVHTRPPSHCARSDNGDVVILDDDPALVVRSSSGTTLPACFSLGPSSPPSPPLHL